MPGVVVGFQDYYSLPEPIRAMITFREYAFMPDSEKLKLVDQACESDLEYEEIVE